MIPVGVVMGGVKGEICAYLEGEWAAGVDPKTRG